MLYLFWIILGFMGGVIVSRNAVTMSHPELAAVFFTMIVSCGIMWWAGYRGKSTAVATAVATAVSIAKAEANANAKAVASSAINLYLGQQAGMSPDAIQSIIDASSVEMIENSRQSHLTHATNTEKEMA